MLDKEKLEKSKTLQNVINAFAGESQARNKYTMYSKIAKKEGFEQIAAIFLETAENEREHAKLFYEYIPNGKHQVDALYPFFKGTTEENLENAANGEHEEWEILYLNGEETAKKEGFEEIADTFHYIRTIEMHHEKRYKKLLEELKNKTLFNKDKEVEWLCRKCGFIHKSNSAPEKCPNCHHPQGYFQVLCEEF